MAGRLPVPCAAGQSPAAAPPSAAAGALTLACLLAAAGAYAAEPPATQVAPVTVTAPRAGCPQKASRPDLACLNAGLAAAARDAHAQAASPPSAPDALGDHAPDRVGTFSYSGIKEQLGSSFGRSAIPQRPQPSAYVRPPLSPPPVPRPAR